MKPRLSLLAAAVPPVARRITGKATTLLICAVLAAIVLGAAGITILRAKYPPVEGWGIDVEPHPAFDTLDPWIRKAFTDDGRPAVARFEDVFRYLIAGFLAYRTEDGSRAHYPGYPSSHGRPVDGLEGFSRIAPLMGAWIAGGRPVEVRVPAFGTVDLLALLRTGIEEGADPSSTHYWGDIGMGDQRVVEAADVALAVWLTRQTLWPSLSPQTRAHLAAWLAQTEGMARGAHATNWLLFPMIANRTLDALNVPVSAQPFARDWAAVQAAHVADGWFRDIQNGQFDYYNAWSFHYGLYWLTRIDPDVDTAFVERARREFVDFYRHLMTPQGFPVLGRSVCYRTAAPVPLVIAAIEEPELIPPGEARRALETTWRYFIERGALAEGVLTQGYCGADVRLLDGYSGPASCLWGTRSLIVALTQPDDAAFWTAEEAPLPVEESDFSIADPTLGWRVVGDREAGSVVIHRLGATANPPLREYPLKHRLASKLLQRPVGRGNRRAKYDRATYSSADPFTGCRREQAQVEETAATFETLP
ncbi:hypothetical protein BH24PSE2_BH24PSE2_05180 [soil metagenome]